MLLPVFSVLLAVPFAAGGPPRGPRGGGSRAGRAVGPPGGRQMLPTTLRGEIRTTTRASSWAEFGLNSAYGLPVYFTESSSISSWPPSVLSVASPRISA